MKRISILMLAVMITSLMPMCVSANTEIYTDERGYTYELDYTQMRASVIGFPSGESTYTVPAVACEKIVDRGEGKADTITFLVAAILPSYSSDLDNAEHITLPYTLRFISQLHNLPKLKSVDFSQCTDLTTLYNYTFENCTALESIDLSACRVLYNIE